MNQSTKNNEQKFTLRPASPDEVGLFYSSEQNDAELFTVGHLRMDFGHQGGEFWSTWSEHRNNELSTPTFKAELDAFVNEMRAVGPLQNLREMQSYCYNSGGNIGSEHGFIAESDQYRYCLRCIPMQGNYNAYLYIYDKHQQELAMQQEPPEQGMAIGGMA